MKQIDWSKNLNKLMELITGIIDWNNNWNLFIEVIIEQNFIELIIEANGLKYIIIEHNWLK